MSPTDDQGGVAGDIVGCVEGPHVVDFEGQDVLLAPHDFMVMGEIGIEEPVESVHALEIGFGRFALADLIQQGLFRPLGLGPVDLQRLQPIRLEPQDQSQLVGRYGLRSK
jgi:hypothetical protein